MIKIDKEHYQVQKELLILALKNSFMSAVGLAISMIVIILAFWDLNNKHLLIIWFFSILLALISRSILATLFLDNRLKIPLTTVKIYFQLYTLISVIFLSIGVLLLMPQELIFHQLILSIIVSGISAGAVMSLSQYLGMIYTYVIILILPFTYMAYMQNTRNNNT
ncbi:MAG: hypothetical protein JJV88_05055 [Sulfurovum sp.]|nr:hypothetical protein [Sulfurovaceae bacterium]